PNACNLRHLDRSLGWTAGHLKAWYGQEPPTDPRLAREESAAVIGLLSGDAGERILWAWHFGWEPARRVSGTDWMAPLLGRLWEDPYSAVRFVAHRSLRGDPAMRGVAYDFVGPEEARAAAAREVGARWEPVKGAEPARRRALLLRDDGSLDAEATGRWQAQRNDRPLHLRE
ncbi:MAG: hypothetical protein IT580_16310, partial [Verrucomicrobiales bacterium]|nr:hypothetical protein [Verrucomicrobiales bacterium]